MRIVIHDFSGHPFQVQLSRELANRGNEVFHFYCDDILGAQGNLEKTVSDPDSLSIEAVSIGRPISRYNFLKRFVDESSYGRALCSAVSKISPDVIVSSNTPLDAQIPLFSLCNRLNIKFVFWLQDILGLAARSVLSDKLGVAGSLIGEYYIVREKRILKGSDHVIPISEDFLATLTRWRVDSSRITVINNWAPLDEMPQRPRDNKWAVEHDLIGNRVAIYSGALGLKHNPQLLWDLAETLEARSEAYKLVVVSEGYGADWLARKLKERPLSCLTLLPFQPFELLPEVLGAADVLLAVLEPEAGEFCVPSKVLSYMCVGRPIVLAADARNLASRLVSEQSCGTVVDPKDSARFSASVIELLDDPESGMEMGRSARLYAEKNFNIQAIGDKFETILNKLA